MESEAVTLAEAQAAVDRIGESRRTLEHVITEVDRMRRGEAHSA